MKRVDPLRLLARPDKWFLGGGNRLLWAPLFPTWLDYPGFWDNASYYNIELAPLFTWTILDEEGREIPLSIAKREWNPSRLTCVFEIDSSKERPSRQSSLEILEEKCCLPDDELASVIRLHNKSKRRRRLSFIAWSVQLSDPRNGPSRISDAEVVGNGIEFRKTITTQLAGEIAIPCSLHLAPTPQSYSLNVSEGSIIQPHWQLTPFVEKIKNGRLPDQHLQVDSTSDGLVFMALQRTIELDPGGVKFVSVTFGVREVNSKRRPNKSPGTKPEALIVKSSTNWIDHFAGVPYFDCSDPYLTRYYWYRWYGLTLLTTSVNEGNYREPFVSEGIGYFRAPISYSAPCHMLENRWRHDPALAQGSLLTFIDNQREDGGFRGYIDPFHYRDEMFYHANWGKALRQLHAVHPDVAFLSKVHDHLLDYVAYFDRERDEEGSGLYDIDNHYETGQEFMHRYVAVEPEADKKHWGNVFRLKGVDVATYMYELKCALAWAAAKLNRGEGEINALRRSSDKTREAILGKMWDPEQQMFFDIDPGTWKQTKVKAATCFYPYMTDIVQPAHVPGLKRHLFNPAEFWTRYPVPSSSADDPYFSPEPEWKGKRMNCPWNGRVWPMTNSHIAEALATTAIRFEDRSLRRMSAEFIASFIRMMFFGGDVNRPNSFEHYHPFRGVPSAYRGVDDYMHSWVADLIISYVAGIRPDEDGITIDPFPFPLERFEIDRIMIRGDELRVRREARRFSVWVNGKLRRRSVLGRPIVLHRKG